jgi:Asp-tRNA(Asn)/Glu-tRNA(Gln) amidotransferase A subunit family amidase
MAEGELWRLPATELQRRYRERSLTPVAAAQACLARLEAVNPRINAVVVRRDPASWRRRRPAPPAGRKAGRCRPSTASR